MIFSCLSKVASDLSRRRLYVNTCEASTSKSRYTTCLSLYYDDPYESAYKVELSKEKAEMIPLVYKYIQENLATGFKVSWSQWKAQFAD